MMMDTINNSNAMETRKRPLPRSVQFATYAQAYACPEAYQVALTGPNRKTVKKQLFYSNEDIAYFKKEATYIVRKVNQARANPTSDQFPPGMMPWCCSMWTAYDAIISQHESTTTSSMDDTENTDAMDICEPATAAAPVFTPLLGLEKFAVPAMKSDRCQRRAAMTQEITWWQTPGNAPYHITPDEQAARIAVVVEELSRPSSQFAQHLGQCVRESVNAECASS